MLKNDQAKSFQNDEERCKKYNNNTIYKMAHTLHLFKKKKILLVLSTKKKKQNTLNCELCIKKK